MIISHPASIFDPVYKCMRRTSKISLWNCVSAVYLYKTSHHTTPVPCHITSEPSCKLLTCSNSDNSFRMQLDYLSWAVCYISWMHNWKQLLLNHCIYVLSWANVGSAMPELSALGRRCASVATRTGANIPYYSRDSENVLPNRHLWIQGTVGRSWTRCTTCLRKLQVCPRIIYILCNPYYIIE